MVETWNLRQRNNQILLRYFDFTIEETLLMRELDCTARSSPSQLFQHCASRNDCILPFIQVPEHSKGLLDEKWNIGKIRLQETGMFGEGRRSHHALIMTSILIGIL